jgi:hypothetical protein
MFVTFGSRASLIPDCISSLVQVEFKNAKIQLTVAVTFSICFSRQIKVREVRY